ncbi:hypothetical protein NKH93_33660 [Mesorhizobium sp. M0954]|uniref:hypothetical protein n=1 Tax=Mesorhizobium sp. M0954 TaxID=2957032 RepID=UPI003337D680
MFAGEIAAKHGDLQQVGGERGPLDVWSRSGRVDLVERSDLGHGENAVGRGVWLGTRRHSDEEYAPTDHRDEGEELGQPLGGFEPCLLRTAAGFMTLWDTSAFQRRAYQPSFSAAAERSSTGKLVTSCQSIGSRPGGGSSSRAWM